MRSKRAALAACVVVAILAGACRAEGPSPKPTPEQPVRGGTLVIALLDDPDHLNPAITTQPQVLRPAVLIYNGLVKLDENLKPQPDLAESFTVEQDGAVYRFTLRQGVRWHDGKPLTPEDVKFTFEEILLKYHPRARSLRPQLQAIETPDEHTIVFRLKEPYAPLLQQLTSLDAPILPKHLFEGTDPLTNPANSKPVGTGPFMFVAHSRGSEVRLARNPDYFRPGLPYFDEVVMRIIPDLGTQVLALQNGEVDYLFRVRGPDIARLRSDSRFEVVRTTRGVEATNTMAVAGFNLDRPLFKDVRVRQAIAHAVDRKQFLEQILFGEGKVAQAPISSGIPWAHAKNLRLPEFDRLKAERLLGSVGWQREPNGPLQAKGVPGVADGSPLKMDLVFSSSQETARYGELLGLQLREFGIDAELRPLDSSTAAETIYKKRDFDIYVTLIANGTDPEIGVRRQFHSADIGPVPFTNGPGYRNPAVDALFERAAHEIDLAVRGDLYREIQEIVAKDLPYIWMVESIGNVAHSASCSGFKVHAALFAEAGYCAR